MKNILIINGHPNKSSFCNALANKYLTGALQSGAKCELINLYDLSFDQNLHGGYTLRTELEPDLLMMQQKITDANHLVFVYPIWWGTYPALLKGFIDRVFLPSFAFKYNDDSLFWSKLLKGKSARLIVTTDTPSWYYRLIYRNAGYIAMKVGVLNFCGISPVKITSLGPIKTSTEMKREKWLSEVEMLGLKTK